MGETAMVENILNFAHAQHVVAFALEHVQHGRTSGVHREITAVIRAHERTDLAYERAGDDAAHGVFALEQAAGDAADVPQLRRGMQYLNFMADVFGVSAADREARTREYGELFGLTSNLGDSIGSFSHGMKQKLALMGALIHDPKLLILDEPFVGLDPVAAHAFKEQMRALCDRGGAVFFSTHVLDVAEKLCDKVAIIKDGRLAAFGDTDAVRGDGSLEELFLELIEQ